MKKLIILFFLIFLFGCAEAEESGPDIDDSDFLDIGDVFVDDDPDHPVDPLDPDPGDPDPGDKHEGTVLGAATYIDEDGNVYLYNPHNEQWERIPSAKEIFRGARKDKEIWESLHPELREEIEEILDE